MSKPASSTPSKSKAAQIYLRAADLVENFDDAACLALDQVQGNRSCDYDYFPATVEFRKLFSPDVEECACWGTQWEDGDTSAKECRVLALCFMAAITARP